MLSVSPEQIDALKSNTDAFMAFSNIALTSAERLTALNLKAARTAFEEGVAASSLLVESSGSMKAPKAIPETATKNALAYFQGVQDIAAEAQQEVTKLMTSYFVMQGHGSSHAASWLKGFETFKTLGQQITEANRKAMADATSKIASTMAPQPTKRAA